METVDKAKNEVESKEVKRLRFALDESLKLQSHYASLLNEHDGGERIGFKTVEEWLKRLDRPKKEPKMKILGAEWNSFWEETTAEIGGYENVDIRVNGEVLDVEYHGLDNEFQDDQVIEIFGGDIDFNQEMPLVDLISQWRRNNKYNSVTLYGVQYQGWEKDGHHATYKILAALDSMEKAEKYIQLFVEDKDGCEIVEIPVFDSAKIVE